MIDYIELGPVPSDEHCAQLGSENYDKLSKVEYEAFRYQIIQTFGVPPGTAHIVRKSFQHDFGTYHELAIKFNSDNSAEMEYVNEVESKLPARWDDNALKYLKEHGYTLKSKLLEA